MDPREPDDRRPRRRERDDDRTRRGDRDRRVPRERPVPGEPGRPSRASATAERAAGYVTVMTGKELEGITSLERTEDGRWKVGVEVVETRRIPDSTDILAVYETELDADGELLSYRRVERYSRCQVKES